MVEATFLFTDIEGSTALLDRLGERYAEILLRERALVTHAVEENGGRVVDARGDELFAAFTSAADGVAAALAAQRALAAENWPVPLRVRMGLHTGRANVAGDAYVGLAVHHAARVSQAAHGGEVLASESTLAATGVIRDAAIRDLGEHDLRGIPCATRLYRIVGAGLPADFPPPRATRSLRDVTRVALADDSVLLREGIAAILEEDGFEVVGQAGTAEDLLDLVASTLPDVAIVDIRMPPTKTDEGIRAAAEIRQRHTRTGVLLLSQHVDVENALTLFAGEPRGLGYLLKDRVADVDDFLAAVRRIAAGGTAIDHTIVAELRSGLWPEHAQELIEAAASTAAVVGG